MSVLVALALVFGQLSLLAIGGINTVLPEMQRQVVDIHHWMSARDFSAMYALAQAAPGPNMMVVTLIGWRVAGWPGVIVTTVAKFLHLGMNFDGVLARVIGSGARSHMRRARSRLESAVSAVADAVDVVDALDAPHGIQHAVEMGRVTHLEDEATERQSVA